MAANTPFPIDPIQTAIAVAYRNPLYIAESVLPTVQVGRQEFKYSIYPVEESFRAPDARAGRRGRVNEVLLSATEEIASTQDWGLSGSVPFPDIDQAMSAGLPNPLDRYTQTLVDYVQVNREKRTADLVFAAAQYGTGNKTQLTGNDQWSVAHDDSNPVDDILTGADAMLMKPTHILMGSAVWRSFRVHPVVVASIHGNDGTVGIVSRRQVADLFEVEEVLVGEQRLNTAAHGQQATLARVWGKHCLLYHLNRNADTNQGISFGYTATYKGMVASTEVVAPGRMGLRGGTQLVVGHSVRELITAPLAAYLIEDAVA